MERRQVSWREDDRKLSEKKLGRKSIDSLALQAELLGLVGESK